MLIQKLMRFLRLFFPVADSPQDVALEAIMDFIKLGKDGRFQLGLYNRFLHAIVSRVP